MRHAVAAVIVAGLAAAGPAHADPDLRTQQRAAGLVVCADTARGDLFYYLPGDIVLATAADGRPRFHFLQMRYTGTAATGDRGAMLHRSTLTFEVKLTAPAAKELQAARQALRVGAATELRPLPISRLDTALLYTPLAEAGATAAPQALPDGHFEASDDSGRSTSTAYWHERTCALGLDDLTSQAFWQALQKGQLVISLGYAFHTRGLGSDVPLDDLRGSPELVAELRKRLQPPDKTPAAGPQDQVQDHVVKAGALEIAVDAAKWPELFQRVDLNESLPPGYPALEVRCYDFNNALRADLAEEQVEIQAESVTGKAATLSTTFEADQPDLYARNLRFPVAVRMDRPYRYRVTEIAQDGTATEGPWRDRESWSRLLDVSSGPGPGSGPRETENTGSGTAPAEEAPDAHHP